nr:MAG TPA: hypothetical protein [Caudoviricetes sp.]
MPQGKYKKQKGGDKVGKRHKQKKPSPGNFKTQLELLKLILEIVAMLLTIVSALLKILR